MNISIFGTGYVGLVTGTCLAESGHDVHCVDVDEDKIDMLNSGQIPIYEPGLKALVASNLAAERIHFSTNPDVAIKHAKVLMITVNTPTDAEGSSNLQYVLAVAKKISEKMEDSKIIVTKSTVPVGTAILIKKQWKRHWLKGERKLIFRLHPILNF